jgi:hypothetical protein
VVAVNIDLKHTLGPAALEANRDYFRTLRIKAHGEYLAWRRLERQTQERLEQLQRTSDIVSL